MDMKKIGRIVLPLVAVMLSGCMRVGLNVELRKDGTASLTARYGMSTEYATEEDFEDDDGETIRFTVDGRDYVGKEETEEYESYDKLNAALTELSEDGTALFTSSDAKMEKGFFTTKYVFDATSASLADEDELEGTGQDISQLIAVDMTLRMPGKAKNVTNGTIQDDGSVKFDFLADKANVFHAESTELNVVNVLICAAAAVIIIAVIAVIATRKKN